MRRLFVDHFETLMVVGLVIANVPLLLVVFAPGLPPELIYSWVGAGACAIVLGASLILSGRTRRRWYRLEAELQAMYAREEARQLEIEAEADAYLALISAMATFMGVNPPE